MDTLEETFGWEQTFLEVKHSDALQLQPQACVELGQARPLQVPSLPGLGATTFTQIISASLKQNFNLVF